MDRILFVARIFFMAFILTITGSWGFLVHRSINQMAVYELPRSLQPFFFQHMNYLVKNSVRPDLRRSEDSLEAPRHFIDLEKFGDSSAWKMPYSWEAAQQIYSRDSLLKYGYVPYYIIIMKNRLTNAFRKRKLDSILYYAADLGHYIGDAHVPLHTTENYDGQLTGQRGMHSLWETVIPELKLSAYDLSSRHRARYLRHPQREVWKAVRQAYSLLPSMFNEERALSAEFTDSTKYRIQMRRGREVKSYSTAFANAFSERLGSTINQQLTRSADMIADFWYTCWKDAGKPDLNVHLNSEEKKKCREEDLAFRHNSLLAKGWLIARQPVEGN